jgi:hypothetical protein
MRRLDIRTPNVAESGGSNASFPPPKLQSRVMPPRLSRSKSWMQLFGIELSSRSFASSSFSKAGLATQHATPGGLMPMIATPPKATTWLTRPCVTRRTRDNIEIARAAGKPSPPDRPVHARARPGKKLVLTNPSARTSHIRGPHRGPPRPERGGVPLFGLSAPCLVRPSTSFSTPRRDGDDATHWQAPLRLARCRVCS